MAYDPPERHNFNIVVFCASPEEAGEVEKIFDYRFTSAGKHGDDPNSYTLGHICGHHIVLVHLRKTGLTVANTAAIHLLSSFPQIKLAFVVGICGVVPRINETEVYLGDCIIGTGVVQYDHGYQHHKRFKRKTAIEHAPQAVYGEAGNFISKLRVKRNQTNIQKRIRDLLQQKMNAEEINWLDPELDCLYDKSYKHYHSVPDPKCDICEPDLEVCRKPCEKIPCDKKKISRTRKTIDPPRLHFGVVGSANTLMKSAEQRETIAKEDSVIAFETESCGIWDSRSTIILRAASTYADSHGNDIWQPFATTVAACTFRAALEILDVYDQIPSLPQHRTMSYMPDHSSRVQNCHLESSPSSGSQTSRQPAQVELGPSSCTRSQPDQVAKRRSSSEAYDPRTEIAAELTRREK